MTTSPHTTPGYPEGTHRADMTPLDALVECRDAWESGTWPDSNAPANLDEVMGHLARLLGPITPGSAHEEGPGGGCTDECVAAHPDHADSRDTEEYAHLDIEFDDGGSARWASVPIYQADLVARILGTPDTIRA